MALILGVTASRWGLSKAQKLTIIQFIHRYPIEELHHGDCVGGDEELHNLIRKLVPAARIVVHPPLDEKLRAFCRGDRVLPQRPYLQRNRDIVHSVDRLVGFPSGDREKPRSGTWYTIRYAAQRKKLLGYITPIGEVVRKYDRVR